MDGYLARGGAVALLTLSAALPAAAQAAGAASPAGSARRDTIIVRRIEPGRIDPGLRDSIFVLMKKFNREPVTSEESARLRAELEAITAAMVRAPGVAFRERREGFFRLETNAKGWLGITFGPVPLHQVMNDSVSVVQYFAHPPIESVERGSPAQAAGIVAGDSLIAYDGVDVIGREINLNQLLTPDRKLGVTVRRSGENKDFQLTIVRKPPMMFIRRFDADEPGLPPIPERAHAAPTVVGGRLHAAKPDGAPTIVSDVVVGARVPVFSIAGNGVFGARMSNLSAGAAKNLNLPPGVLVQEVPDATPASRAGLQAGDIVVAVGGQTVSTISDVQSAIARSDRRSVTFQVIRDHKPRALTLVWGSATTSP